MNLFDFRPSPRRWLRKPHTPTPMANKSNTLFEVFVPQQFFQVTIRRTPSSFEVDVATRQTGDVRTHKHPRRSPSRAPGQFGEDFQLAMGWSARRPV